jgi:hypothetical protein
MDEVEVRVKGMLDKSWSDWLGGLSINHTRQNETILKGMVRDQAALFGLFEKLSRLGLQLVFVSLKSARHAKAKEVV